MLQQHSGPNAFEVAAHHEIEASVSIWSSDCDIFKPLFMTSFKPLSMISVSFKPKFILFYVYLSLDLLIYHP